jgi:hypothetical protein
VYLGETEQLKGGRGRQKKKKREREWSLRFRYLERMLKEVIACV